MEPYGGLVRTMSGSGTIGPVHDRKMVGYFLAQPRKAGLLLEADRSILEGSMIYGTSPESQAYIRILTRSGAPFEDGWFGVVYGYPELDENDALDRIAQTNGLIAESVIESVVKAYASLKQAAD